MAIKWDSSLSVGVDEIDTQHKALIESTNELLEACRQGNGKAAVGKILAFLETYVVEHFKTEERLQKWANYPKHSHHKGLHTEFMINVAELKKQFNTHGPTLPFVIMVNKAVVEWLSTHINKEDKDFGLFLRKV